MTGGSTSDFEQTVVTERPLAEDTLGVGASVGRYVIVDVLGAGGMGKVFRAYDPKLRREVALKTVHIGLEQAYAVREAQAMAKLSHPNVVPVFDVEQVDEQLFIAMEFVAGHTLDGWLEEEERGWREILGVMLGAGRGLAAAHDAELIHRDFKPSNVMIGRDGRARVMDFGIARTENRVEPAAASTVRVGGRDVSAEKSSDALSTPLTRHGAVVGTPPYMAPEQMRGKDLDARADQYAFCVATWEALYGARPFSGSNPTELLRDKKKARPKVPSGDVPAQITSVLLRGLAYDPGERWPSMMALLEALDYDPRARLRRWLGISTLGAGALALAALVWFNERQDESCQGGQLGEIWGPQTSEELRGVLSTVPRADSTQAAERVVAGLDTWAERWEAARLDNCEDSTLRHEQSESLMDRRSACLARARRGFTTAVELLTNDAPEERLRGADDMVAALPDLDACEDIDRLLNDLAQPPPESEARVEAIRGRLAEIRALESAGALPDLDELDELLTEAQSLDYGPLEAEVLHQRGGLADRHGEPKQALKDLRGAFLLARSLDYDDVAISAIMDLSFVVGYVEQNTDEGLELVDQALAEVEQGGRPVDRAILLRYRGLMLIDTGRIDEATTQLDEARSLMESIDGLDPFNLGSVMNDQAIAQIRQSNLERAAELWEQAIEVGTQARGVDHPAVIAWHNNLAIAYRHLGRYEDARRILLDALAANEQLYGEDSGPVRRNLLNLGNVEADAGELSLGIEYLTRARDLAERSLDAGHPGVAQTRASLAQAVAMAGRSTEALELFSQALDELEGEHPLVRKELHAGRAQQLLDLGRPEEALVAYSKAAELGSETVGEQDVQTARSRLGQARCELALDHPARALPLAEAAHATIAADESLEPSERAWAGYVLARALGLTGGEQGRRHALLESAEANAKDDEALRALVKLERKGD